MRRENTDAHPLTRHARACGHPVRRGLSIQAQPPLEYWIARSSGRRRAERAGHNAPSPDDASHRRENHEAMTMRKRNALIRSTTGGTRADEPDHHSSVNRFEFSADWQQEAAVTFSLPAIVLISLREFPEQAALSSGTPWPSRRCLAAAESRIRRRCAGAGDRLKRSQQIERLIQRFQVAVERH
jgi:hypothetical protein